MLVPEVTEQSKEVNFRKKKFLNVTRALDIMERLQRVTYDIEQNFDKLHAVQY